jgi:hypothetical protein
MAKSSDCSRSPFELHRWPGGRKCDKKAGRDAEEIGCFRYRRRHDANGIVLAVQEWLYFIIMYKARSGMSLGGY